VNMTNGGADAALRHSRWHGRILDDSIKAHKTGDTLFILGSGPSINRLTEAQWRHIARHDSVGFNWWMLHEFVPTFYVLQYTASPALSALMRHRSAAYRKVPMMVRGDFVAQGLIRLDEDPRGEFLRDHDLYFMREYPISSRCSIPIESLLRHAELLGMLSHNQIGPFVPKWGCTLGLLISWGYQMGYRKLVLCGMDMTSNEHFWHEPTVQHLYRELNPPPCEPARRKGKSYGIMAFSDSSISTNTIPRYVTTLARWMGERAQVEIRIQSTDTILHPDLALHNFEDQAPSAPGHAGVAW
jgi:hypothetical protein